MFILGLYYSYQRKTNIKTITLFSSMLLLLLIIPFSPNFSMDIVLLLPFVYIGIITGIVELINQWFTYFPRNPLARNIGISLLVFSISLTSAYHLESYFVAWPNDPDTKAVYVIKS
jgi:NhaP-type Na+/H+ and K+/H+ antiporter